MGIAALMLAGCAPKTPPVSAMADKPDLSARLDAIKSRQDAQDSAMLAMQERLALLDSRLTMVEAGQQLRKGAAAQPQPEVTPPVMPQAKPEAKKTSTKLAPAAKKAEAAPKPAAKKAEAKKTPTKPPAMSEADQAKMQKALDAAMRMLKSGDYDQAISALGAFIQQYPDTESTPQARYWLGEALFSQMKVSKAVDTLKPFEAMPVTTPKRAPALFRLAAGYQRQGAKTDAARVYAELRRDYPGSIEANNAARQMKRLGVIAPPLTPPAKADGTQAAKADQPQWAVNIVSLDVRQDAAQMLAKLRKQGMQAQMMKVKVAGKFWYRLRIPGYADRAAAESARLKIIGKGYADAWVSPE